jgi:hypothetical protein
MADGGLVDPSRLHLGHYDSGGGLPPGLTIAYNGTGEMEQVYTAADHARAQTAMAGGGRPIEVNIHPRPNQSEYEIGKASMREIAWRLGR